MIYFENYLKGTSGLNNHLIPYTLCLSLSHFLDCDFFFDDELPSRYPPDFAINSELKDKFQLLLTSPRSLLTDLLDMPARRVFEIDREQTNKIRLADVSETFVTTAEFRAKYENTMIWRFFSLGREVVVKEDLQNYDLVEIGDKNLVAVSYFYFLNRTEKTALLDAVKIRYAPEIENLAAKIKNEIGEFNAIHLRIGDFLKFYQHDDYAIDAEKFGKYLDANLEGKDLPILVATDGLHEKELFADLLKNYRYFFIDELIFNDFSADFESLPFTDFNVLTVLNQILCAEANLFVGTCRSTLTSIVHRLRQERFGKTDFLFFPDARISRILSPDLKIQPDAQGFFEWNRYSVFAESYHYPAWMREWNYQLTMLNF